MKMVFKLKGIFLLISHIILKADYMKERCQNTTVVFTQTKNEQTWQPTQCTSKTTQIPHPNQPTHLSSNNKVSFQSLKYKQRNH